MTTHAALAEDRTVLLVVDVCVAYTQLVGSDYFVVEPSRQNAESLVADVKQFLTVQGVKVDATLVPFVCGALHDAANVPKKVATAVDGDIADQAQPFWLAPPLVNDATYRAALLDLATYWYQGALAQSTPAGQAPAAAPRFIDDGRAREAMRVVRERSGHDNLIYIGVTGSSLSTGGTAVVNTLRFVAGVAISVAIGPIYVGSGSAIGVVYVPGIHRDAFQMAAALVDLRSARVPSSRVVHATGDPLKPEVLGHRNALGLLLRELTLAPKGR